MRRFLPYFYSRIVDFLRFRLGFRFARKNKGLCDRRSQGLYFLSGFSGFDQDFQDLRITLMFADRQLDFIDLLTDQDLG